MSRICVKNLPKYVAEDRLREVFSRKGEITDVKLMRTKDGKSRQFAFIGFRTEHEAEEALKFFNKSYLDTCRLTCEIARKIGDPNIPRPWSRHSLKKEGKLIEEGKNIDSGKSSSRAASKGEKMSLKKGNENDDPRLQEFLQVMQPRSKTKFWANDDTLVPPPLDQQKTQSKIVREEPAPLKADSNEIDENENVLDDNRGAQVSRNLAHDDVISDMDYFKSRVKKEWSDSESSGEDDHNEDNNNVDDSEVDDDDNNDDDDDNNDDDDDETLKESLEIEQKVDSKRDIKDFPDKMVEMDGKFSGEVIDSGSPSSSEVQKDVLETGRLFIRNLPYTATEDELEELFSKFGDVSQAHLVVDKETKRSKGIAYVLYTLPEAAARALEELDNTIFQGRLLHIMPAKQKGSSEKQEANTSVIQSSKTFRQKREEERKASEASGDTRAWNSLFMRPDTVVENIARKHGVSKSDLLDREADDLAVRIALGETQVIAETKNALVNAGVNVGSLEKFAAGKTDGMKRSNHILLVKNLPYGSSEGELAKMFGNFGSLDKIILPSTKALALAVFLEPAEARAAFRNLAYKRYKDAPLYLEWAPGDILSQSPKPDSDPKASAIVGEHDAKRVLLEQGVEGILDVDIDPDRVESRSLFVKNLNFKTSDENLKTHFIYHTKEGRILSVRVKKHLKNGKNVSMGFGFIEFDSVETAANICRDLQGTILDGHALILQLCHAKKDEQVQKRVEKDKSSTKLIVRNVAFEATEKDLRQLFSPFGQIKSLRLPKKFGNHRGFAFVEYVTKQEAQNALQALSSTHLYGRHLVLERAKEGESLEELRARTAAQFPVEQNGFQNPTKVSKKRKHIGILDEGTVKFDRIAD
ncbi:multiple RNA-binding domain-containing protein 1 isoform X2 [Malania oleifera]|uniref:multiple RNA-binding domain-containing protein 1 isoform X2 n=1 Tax=Malania oleifera TaxID=397392 RepID=UPI0025AE1205|nr:multiple RNA-binding domain-containing protein 1 isoform X2 [Malania oleifera]